MVATIERAQGAAVAAVLDVTTSAGATGAVEAAIEAFGRIDVLVNNVGHFGGARKAFHENTDDEWDELYRVNLAHVLGASCAAIASMLAQGDGGSIVNVSTIEAFRAIPTRAVYSAFKAAITGFTRSVAVEYARDGIRVNAIAPDVVETLQVPYSRWVKPEQEHLVPTWVPLGRFGRPADVADVALFLASDLSRFVTGTTVHVDGGHVRRGRLVPDRRRRLDEPSPPAVIIRSLLRPLPSGSRTRTLAGEPRRSLRSRLRPRRSKSVARLSRARRAAR